MKLTPRRAATMRRRSPAEKNLNLGVESLQGVKEPGVFRVEKETNFIVRLKEGREYQKNWQSKC